MLLRLGYLTVSNMFAMLRLLPIGDRDKDSDITRLGAVQWGNSHTWQFDTPTGLRGELHMGIIHVQKIAAGIEIENWLAGQFVALVKKLQSIPSPTARARCSTTRWWSGPATSATPTPTTRAT